MSMVQYVGNKPIIISIRQFYTYLPTYKFQK